MYVIFSARPVFWRCAGILAVLGTVLTGALAQSSALPVDLAKLPAKSWVEAAAVNEVKIIDDDGSFPLRYRIRKIDAKGDVMRDTIESRQGTVARLIQRDGRPLQPQEDTAERMRLNDLINDPVAFAKHHKRDNAARGYSTQLVCQLPQAMLFSYVPGQPQRPGLDDPQVVIDFSPDANFRPPNMISGVLTGIAGRMWIDRKSQHLVRIEGRVLKPVDFGWGMLARIYAGGTVEFEQSHTGGDRWVYSHVRENITIREMMVKTAQQHNTMDAAGFQLLPAPVSYQEAIRLLLATPLPQ